jgi:hypothetical protein
MPEPVLVEKTVRFEVSSDTLALWEALAAKEHLSLDAMLQVLALYGAALLARADLGELGNMGPADLSPQRIAPLLRRWMDRQGQS